MDHDQDVFNEIELMRRENESLRAALEFYADQHNWKRDYVGGAFTDSLSMEDGGATARRALGIVD